MESDSKTLLFEQMPIQKAIIKLSVPTVLSSLVMVIYNLADTYFVGMLNDPIQNAAVTLAAPVLLAFNAVNNLFGVGSSSMMSRALGRKDYDTVKRSSAFSFYMSVLCGILFSLICITSRTPLLRLLGTDSENLYATTAYIKWTVMFGATPAILNVVMAYMVRSEGASLHASLGTMSGCILNIILDPIFILPGGLNMGAEGAGMATFISNYAACLYFFILLFCKRKSTYISLSPKKAVFKKPVVFGICGVGIPASVQNLLNVTGMTILNNFTSVYGSTAVAAMGIAQKINIIPLQIALGFSQGIMPLISYNYASGNIERMKDSLIFSIKTSVTFMIAVTAIYFGFAGNLTHLFIDNTEIVAYGTSFLRGMCLSLVFLNMDFIAVGVFQACGMGKLSFAFAVMRKVVLEIPALFILNATVGLYGLAYAQTAAEIILAVIAAAVLKIMFRKLKNN